MHCTHTFPSTNHTAVTNHSFALIASPHLHLIHTLTYKQHTYTHPLRSLVLPWLTFWAFPLYSVSLCLPGLPIRLWPFAACLLDPACLVISSLSAACPDLCIIPVADSALPTWHLLLPLTLACLTLPCCLIKLHLNLTTLPLRYRRLRHNKDSAAFPKNPGQEWIHSTSCSTWNRGVRLLRNTSLNSTKYLARYRLMRLH